jgi:hypothetical protein
MWRRVVRPHRWASAVTILALPADNARRFYGERDTSEPVAQVLRALRADAQAEHLLNHRQKQDSERIVPKRQSIAGLIKRRVAASTWCDDEPVPHRPRRLAIHLRNRE